MAEIHRGSRTRTEGQGSAVGFVFSDAKMEAGGLPAKREAAKAQAAMDASQARRRAEQVEAEAEAAAKADRPMEQAEAFEFIRASIHPRSVPRPVNRRLQRTGESISPNALEAIIRGWQRCPECEDGGTVGNAIDKTLAFCSCAAGIEARELPTSMDLAEPEAEHFHRGPIGRPRKSREFMPVSNRCWWPLRALWGCNSQPM